MNNIIEIPNEEKIGLVKIEIQKLLNSKMTNNKSGLQVQNLFELIDLLFGIFQEAKRYDQIILKRYRDNGKFKLEKNGTNNETNYQQATVKFHITVYSILSTYNHILELIGIPFYKGKIKHFRSVENSLKIWDEIAKDDEAFLIQTDFLKASYIFRTFLDHPHQYPVMNWLTTYGKNILVIYYVPISEEVNNKYSTLLSKFEFNMWQKMYEQEPLKLIMSTVAQNTFYVVPSYEDTFNALLFYLKSTAEYFSNISLG